MKNCFIKNLPLKVIYFLLPILVFSVIWVPEINHYYSPNIIISGKMIEKARTIPSDSLLDEITCFFKLRKNMNEEKLVASAENILQGQIEIPGHPPQ